MGPTTSGSRSIPTRSWTRSRSSSPALGRRLIRTEGSPPSCSPTSWTPPPEPPRSVIPAGVRSSMSTTRSFAKSWHASAGARSTPPATASWPPSTGRVVPSAAPARSAMRWLASERGPGRRAYRRGGGTGRADRRARRAHRRRVAATGGGGDIVVSSTVKDLVAGSGLTFVDRGEHELKGVPGTWRLFTVEG
jgi:hypothetical protein